MPRMQLFRIHVTYPVQMSLLHKEMSRPQLLDKIIESRPTARLYQNRTWHIGNISRIDEASIYFKIGRTKKLAEGIYEDGNFVDTEAEFTPYTHVLLDLEWGVVAIAYNSKLSNTPSTIANSLDRLLQQSELAAQTEVEFETRPIADPRAFIEHLGRSYAIKSFWFTFKRPNPFDPEKDIHKPLQKTLDIVNAREGEMSINGDSLNRDNLVDLTRSIASAGDDAGAEVISDPRGSSKKIRLKVSEVTIEADDMDPASLPKLIKAVRECYNDVRRGKEPDQ